MTTPSDSPGNDPNLSGLGRALLDTGGSKSSAGTWVPPTAEELHAILPQYEIVKMLGRGGMGAVYMGRQTALDRPVAIKILSAQLEESDMGFTERFKNEARAMGKLNHPAIVSVYEFGQHESGLLYIVMEYVDGTDVAKMIAKSGRLHTEHAMAISAHVCDALAYAHERGIIHRDIKPANIMVGYDGMVKVADFGLAKVSTDGRTLGLTQSGMAMGTMHYMAPEALMLGTSVDHRADIYAVGVMLYQMLTGKLPQGMVKLPSLLVPGLDPRYDAIVRKALMEDRESRYQGIRELRAELDSILTQPVMKVEPAASAAEVKAAVLPTGARPQRPGGKPLARPASISAPDVVQQQPSGSYAWLWTTITVLLVLSGVRWFMFGTPKQESEVTPQPAAPSALPALVVTDKTAVEAPPATAIPAPLPPGWLSLFNGKDLSGWDLHPSNFPADVQDGAIRIRGSSSVPISGNMYYRGAGTEVPQWTDYELICTVKTENKGNSGIYFHASPGIPDSNRANGIEVQIWNDLSQGSSGKSGSLHGLAPALTARFGDGEWFQVKTRVEGKRIQTWLKKPSETEWLPAAEWTQSDNWAPPSQRPGLKLGSGTISMQNNPPLDGVVWFKDIQFRELNAPAVAASAPSAAPTTLVETFNGHRYQFVSGSMSWTEAKAKAESMGGHLATLTTKEENEWLLLTYRKLLPATNRNIWLGASESAPGAGWKWVTGEPFTPLGWFPGEPNSTRGGGGQVGHPFMLNLYSFKEGAVGWNDSSTHESQSRNNIGFIVEWDSVTPATTTTPVVPSGWQPLFPNYSLTGWKGDTTGYRIANSILTSTDKGGDLISPKEYGSFHLKFDLRLSPGGNSGIGVWCADNNQGYKFLAHTGFEIQLLDDLSPTYTTGKPWQSHGALTYFITPKAKPMGQPWSWNTHEIRMEGTHLTVIINNVIVIDQELPAGDPVAEGSRKHRLDLTKKRGHLVFCGMKGPVDFKNVMIKDLDAAARTTAQTPPVPLPTASAATWIDTKGRSLQAKFVRLEGANVLLDVAGKDTPVALASLSAASQQQARDLQATLPAAPAVTPPPTPSAPTSKAAPHELALNLSLEGGANEEVTVSFGSGSSRIILAKVKPGRRLIDCSKVGNGQHYLKFSGKGYAAQTQKMEFENGRPLGASLDVNLFRNRFVTVRVAINTSGGRELAGSNIKEERIALTHMTAPTLLRNWDWRIWQFSEAGVSSRKPGTIPWISMNNCQSGFGFIKAAAGETFDTMTTAPQTGYIYHFGRSGNSASATKSTLYYIRNHGSSANGAVQSYGKLLIEEVTDTPPAGVPVKLPPD